MLLTTIVFEPGMFTKFEPGYSGSLVKQNLSHRVVRFRSNFMIYPIGSMYGIYANIGGILMVNVSIYSIHGSYGIYTTGWRDFVSSQLIHIFQRGRLKPPSR